MLSLLFLKIYSYKNLALFQYPSNKITFLFNFVKSIKSKKKQMTLLLNKNY